MILKNTKDAIGDMLCHDITQIIKDVKKDAVFRKGHIIRPEDVEVLLSVGKDHIYVWEDNENMMHENEAAQFMIDLTKTDDMTNTAVKEGKMELIADKDGYFMVNTQLLKKINMQDDMMIATIKGNIPVKKGDKLAGMRVIPLIIEKEKMQNLKEIISDEKLFEIRDFKRKKAGIVTTGNEVYHKRIKDQFTPVVKEKLARFGVETIAHEIVYDDTDMITDAIKKLKNQGCDVIVCTGGMSVDPDDLTPKAIKLTANNIVSYGAPMLPGAMFLLGYFDDETPIMGLPGCVMYARTTIFDIILPRVLANVKTDKEFIASLGYGGLCLQCEKCHYPNCQFGKGV